MQGFYTGGMAVTGIIAPNLEDGIDRKTLKELKKRFMEVNSGRLERTKSALPARHQRFLDVLPLLLHVNHPLLPGYNNSTTPAIIGDYKPDQPTLQQAQCLTRSFKYKHHPKANPDIYSVFLMGSTGTIAHSASSDMDVWVVYRPELDQSQIDDLRVKLDSITEWAKSIGLEAYFFLMNPVSFRQGERQTLEGEDCGSAQHYLLLDEFYRTALLVAGSYPLWWLVPPDEEINYPLIAETLLSKRFIRAKETIDFGGISELPAGEFIGAGMWHLYKGVDSAYKSVLKICLTEIYAAEHPNVESLSHYFKQAIYNNQLDLDELDPYIMVYRKIEHYLEEKDDLQRLELIRRCLYFKINIPMSKTKSVKLRTWRWLLMRKFVTEWNWDKTILERLDNRQHWSVMEIFAERNALVNQLTLSYRYLADFASRHSDSITINHRDMIVLGRKLYAAFERKGGKIELVNPGISSNIAEDHLSIHSVEKTLDDTSSNSNTDTNAHASANTTGWICYSGLVTPDQTEYHSPVKRTESIIELLTWGYFNGLTNRNTRYYLQAGDSDLTEHELQQTAHSFSRLFPDSKLETGHDQFHKPTMITHTALFLNVGCDPLREQTKKGISVLTSHTDALKYSALHNNLAVTVDQVLINSWGEILTSRYASENAILDCLIDYLKALALQSEEPLPELNLCCFCASRKALISNRIEELFKDICDYYFHANNPLSSRYILEIDRNFYVIQFQNDKPTYKRLKTLAGLKHYLGEPQAAYSPIVLDRHSDSKNDINLISDYFTSDKIQVFYKLASKIDLYVSDFSGALFFAKIPKCKESILLSHLQLFIHASLYRRTAERNTDSLSSPNKKIVFYRIKSTKKQQFTSIERQSIHWSYQDQQYYNVQAIADLDGQGGISFTIFCNHKEFSELQYGDQIYQAVAQYILSQRSENSSYPCYLTDLDLSRIEENQYDDTPVQIAQLFRYKQRIEQKINATLLN